jgi:carboxylesterase type B
MRAWLRFAATGSPEGVAGPAWPAFGTGQGARVLRLDAATTLVEAPEPALCRIYRERTVR